MELKNPTTDQTPDVIQADAFKRRNNRGCKSEDFYNWPEQSLEEMDSPLAVQQYIQQLINRNPADIDDILRLPEGQDLGAWKIEHLRIFCMQLNRLAARLQDCCYPETCNQMTATEQWIFLCAAHKQPNECPAIDYTRHALDSAASLLNSNKYFPSRVTIKESSVAKLGSVCRRVYRIFSHAYYHHFQVFDEFEKETHLCGRFSKFVTMYELLSKESLIVPSDGSRPEPENEQKVSVAQAETTMIDSANSSTQVVPLGRESVLKDDVEVTKCEPAVEEGDVETTTPRVSATTSGSVMKMEPKAEEKTAATITATASPKTNTSWAPSQTSTNTMVKGTSNASPKGLNPDSPSRLRQTPIKSESMTGTRLTTAANSTSSTPAASATVTAATSKAP